jgi:hypothetical protein
MVIHVFTHFFHRKGGTSKWTLFKANSSNIFLMKKFSTVFRLSQIHYWSPTILQKMFQCCLQNVLWSILKVGINTCYTNHHSSPAIFLANISVTQHPINHFRTSDRLWRSFIGKSPVNSYLIQTVSENTYYPLGHSWPDDVFTEFFSLILWILVDARQAPA